MLSFKSYIKVLYEDRLDYLKRTMPQINSSHDSNAEHRDSDKIVDHFATKADPSKNKQYTQWIVNKYHKGDFRQEDHPRIKETLEDFDRYKPHLEHKDINKYKSLHDLESAVEPHVGTEPEISDTAKEKELKEKGATLVHSANGLTVHRLNDMNGAMIYGRGTKWCTAATKATVTEPNTGEDGISRPIRREGTIVQHTPKDYPMKTSMSSGGIRMDDRYHIKMKDTGKIEEHPSSIVSHGNMFHQYHEDGPMYVIHTPDGEKYQYHPATDQFMDKNDREVNISNMIEKHSGLRNVKEFKEAHHIFLNKDEFEKKAGYIIDNINFHVDTNHDGEPTPQHIVNSPYLTPSHVDKIASRVAHDEAKGISNGGAVRALYNSRALKMMSQEQKERIFDGIDKNPSDWMTKQIRDTYKEWLNHYN